MIGPGAVGATFAAGAEDAGHELALCGRRPVPPPVVERPDGSPHALGAPLRADPGTADGPAEWVLLGWRAPG